MINGNSGCDGSQAGKYIPYPLNGHKLGRYWNIGPQQTVYFPAELLKKGHNEIVVIELLKTLQTHLTSVNKPILNKLKN